MFSTTPVVEIPGRTFCFPTPASDGNLTLRNIKICVGTDPQHQPAFFEHPWYENEGFMATPCVPGWHLVAMEPLPASIQQPLDYLRSLGNRDMVLPQAVEVVLMLFLHFVGTGEQLLLKKHTWCSETASMNRHVTVGAFGRNGVFLSGHPENFSSQGLGVCPRITPTFSARPEFG
jgi:hypothetical protein